MKVRAEFNFVGLSEVIQTMKCYLSQHDWFSQKSKGASFPLHTPVMTFVYNYPTPFRVIIFREHRVAESSV